MVDANGTRRRLVLFTEFKDTLTDLAARSAIAWARRKPWWKSMAVCPGIAGAKSFMPS